MVLPAYAQRPAYATTTSPQEALMAQAEEAFRQAEWADCLDRLQELKASAADEAASEAAAFMVAVASARRDLAGSDELLRNYLTRHPRSAHAAEARMELGTWLLRHGDPQGALAELNRVTTREIAAPRQPDLFFRKGQALVETGRYAEARPYYVALEQAGDPDFGTEASYYLAYLNYRRGNLDEALVRFRLLPDSGKYRLTTPYYIAQILYKQEQWDEARAEAERLLATRGTTDEQAVELHRLVGECALRQGQREEALAHLTAYVDGATEVVAASAYDCGILAADAGDTSLAATALGMATRPGGDDVTAARAYMRLGQLYAADGKLQDARMAYERAAAIEADPATQEAAAYNYAVIVHETAASPFGEEVTLFENFLNRYPHSRYADRASEYLVEAYMTTRNYEAALASIDKIRRPSPTVRAARQRLLYRLGVQAYVNGDIDGAAARFDTCIALGNLNATTQAEAHYWRGECRYAAGRYAEAEADARAFWRARPAVEASYLASGLYNLGYAYFKQGKYAAAIETFGTYIAQPSERNTAPYADALARLGDCHYYGRDFARAERYYDASAATRTSPTAPYGLYQKAFMAGLQKKYTTKLDVLDQLVRDYPTSEYIDDAYLEKGKTYLLLDNAAAAIEAFREVVDRFASQPCAPQAGLQLALVYYNTGRTSEAIVAYKDVIRTHPGSDEAQTALEDLKNIYVESNDVAAYAAYRQTLGGKVPMAADEQDSLTYVAATRLLAAHKESDGEAALEAYLAQYPNGRYAVEAHLSLARATRAADAGRALAHYAVVADMAGHAHADEALLAVAEIHRDSDRADEAAEAYRRLASRTADTDLRRTALMEASRLAAAAHRPAEVVALVTQLLAEPNLKMAEQQEAHLRRGTALAATGDTTQAAADLQTAAADMRLALGAEAKYRLAQLLADGGSTTEAEAQVAELIHSGTPHQYWLARAFILMADIALTQGDTFRARQYLQSLQNNYTMNPEINRMIENRLENCKE